MPDVWVTTAEAAKVWRVDPRTVVRWINDGLIIGCKLGPRTYRVLVSKDIADTVIEKATTGGEG